MRTLKWAGAVVLAVAISPAALAGCGDSEELAEPQPADPGTASCTGTAPCGGDLVGRWRFVSGCFDLDEAVVAPGCADVTSSSSVAVSGTLEFKADGTFLVDSKQEVTANVTIPNVCVDDLGSCDTTAGCSSNGSSCSCTIPVDVPASAASGTYRVNGTTLTRTAASTSTTVQFCRAGDKLTFDGAVTGAIAGYTLSRIPE